MNYAYPSQSEMVAIQGVLHKTKLEGEPEALTFGFMQLFDLMKTQGPGGLSKSCKRRPFRGTLNESCEFGGSCLKQNLKVTQKNLLLV